jgi:hypothetical protein
MLLLLILFAILVFILLLFSCASRSPTHQLKILRPLVAREGKMTVRSWRDRCPISFGGFRSTKESVYNQSMMEAAMTLTPELKQAVEKAGDEPVRVEDPETHTAYLIVREDVFRRLYELIAIDHGDRSLYEFGEFRPDP